MRETAPTPDPVAATGWVEQRLGVTLSTVPGPLGVAVPDLVGLAVRRNPRRAQLLVSTVLGKHRPTDPALIRGAGLLLGALVAQRLGVPVAAASLGTAGEQLVQAVRGEPEAVEQLAAVLRLLPNPADALRPAAGEDVLVIGYAETATALGHTVADALGADLLTSTRRAVPTAVDGGGFEEEHSHATGHRLLPDDPRLLDAAVVVLVDDELSTGTTVLNTIALLERRRPGRRYVAAALVDLRSDADADRLTAAAAALGADVQVVALAAGAVHLPDDVLQRAAAVRAEFSEAPPASSAHGPTLRPAPRAIEWVTGAWPPDVRHHGRHGFRQADRAPFEAALTGLAGAVAARLRPGRVHVLGTEELMVLPQRLAGRIAGLLTGAAVTSSATTRSPVMVRDEDGYPIRSALAFPAHDGPADEPGERFAYNLGPAGTVDAVVLVVDERGSTEELTGPSGLVPQLAGLVPHVVVVVVPDGDPAVAA